MDWMLVKEWLENHGHINSNWDCVAVSEDSFYAEDKMENTFISLFQRGGCELVAIVGMMLGSLYSIVMGPTSLDTPKAAMNFDTFSLSSFLIGGGVIFGLQALKHMFAKKEEGKAE